MNGSPNYSQKVEEGLFPEEKECSSQRKEGKGCWKTNMADVPSSGSVSTREQELREVGTAVRLFGREDLASVN